MGLLEQLLVEHEPALGPDHEKIRKAKAELGVAHRHAGRLDEAVATLEQARGDGERPDLGTALSTTYGEVGRADEALLFAKRALDHRVPKLGSNHSEMVRMLNNLAMAHHKAGNLPAALATTEEAVAACAGWDDAGAVAALVSQANLAGLYALDGQAEKAFEIVERIYLPARERFGEDHWIVTALRSNFGIRGLDT